MRATDCAEQFATDYTEHAAWFVMPRGIRLLSRLLPSTEREAILGDLLEDAEYRDLRGARLRWWLAGECARIGLGLSIVRVRGWLVLPPVREVVSGFAVDGRGALRDAHPLSVALRVLIFCGSMATIMLGAELLVSSLLRAF